MKYATVRLNEITSAIIGKSDVADTVKEYTNYLNSMIKVNTNRVKKAQEITEKLYNKFKGSGIEYDCSIRTAENTDKRNKFGDIYMNFYSRIYLNPDYDTPIPKKLSPQDQEKMKKRDSSVQAELAKLSVKYKEEYIEFSYDNGIIRVTIGF